MLSRAERRVAVAVVVTGLVMLVAMAVIALRWADVVAWLDGPAVRAAHEAVEEVVLPGELEDDPTRSACEDWIAIRCAWSAATPDRAAEALADALRGAGLEVDPVVCDEPGTLPEMAGGASPRCGAKVAVQGGDLWLYATDVTLVGAVPLGRTAAWAAWDSQAMSPQLQNQLWGGTRAGESHPLTADEVAAMLPTRIRGVTELACWTAGPEACAWWEGPLDVTDLDPETAVAAIVAELADEGFFVTAADGEWQTAIQAHRFASSDDPMAVTVTVRLVDGTVVARVLAL